MAIDREATLRTAEKHLRVGRLDAAIAEYVRVVDDQPKDLSTANTLGDLYVRIGQPDKAIPLYERIADHLLSEGFYPRAGALLKKILKIRPDDETALAHLGDIAARQGLITEAKGYYGALINLRRGRGDTFGADEMQARVGALDPSDVAARVGGAEALERRGEGAAAATRYRELYDELVADGRSAEAKPILAAMLRCQQGEIDPSLLLQVISADLESGDLDAARGRMPDLLIRHPDPEAPLLAIARTLLPSGVDAADLCVQVIVDHVVSAGRNADAARILQDFTTALPGHIPWLLRLIEVGVDAGLDSVVDDAQGRLADAYLAEGRAEEARVIAEDLVTRNPSDEAHIARLRQSLERVGVADVERVIADRRAGASPDPLDWLSAASAEPIAASPEPVAAPEPIAPAPTTPAPVASEPVAPEPLAIVAAEVPVVIGTQPSPAAVVSEIDLTIALGELQGASAPPAMPEQPRELEAVFADLRHGLDANAADQSEDYLSLGRSYMDMGMTDEAIRALSLAVKSPRHRFACASQLAQLHRDLGDIPRAIEWYEQAADAPPPSPEDGHRVMYELGDLLETMGENARALAVFIEIDAAANGYQDVAARVRRLSADQGGG